MQIQQLFLDDIWLPDKGEQLPSIPLFYEKDRNQKIAAISGIAISLLGFFFRYFKSSSALFILAAGALVWNLSSEYNDAQLRKEFRKELDTNKLTIEQYIAKHGWEKIKLYGFEIHPLNGSLLTQEELKKIVFEHLEENICCFFHKRNENLHQRKGFLWQCFDQGIFQEDDIRFLQKLFKEKFSLISMNTLFENFTEIRQFALLKDLDNIQVMGFLEENWIKFEKVEQQFIYWREKIMYAFQKEKSYLSYPAPVVLYRSGKPPILMPDTQKLNQYYEQLSQMKQKYVKEYQRLKEFRDQALLELQTRFDKLLER